MPPKAKFSREDIVNVAYEITREKSIDAVTAQEVSRRLNSSVSPIFTQFSSVEEIRDEVRKKANSYFEVSLKKADDFVPSLKMRGILMIRFAQNEPSLFKLLFMTENKTAAFKMFMKENIKLFENDIKNIAEKYELEYKKAEFIFDNIWIHAYGICSLCVLKVCTMTEEEISGLLSSMFMSLLNTARNEEEWSFNFSPVKKGTPESKKFESAAYV